MKRTGLWLSVLVGLQVLCLIGAAVSTQTRLQSKTTVLLETLPVDPRDLLRGDYVILNYKISGIPRQWVQQPLDTRSLHNRTLYVALEKRGEFYEATRAGLERFPTRPGEYLVRGMIEQHWTSNEPQIRVRYGIEKYFVKEGTGNPRGKVTVECVVDQNELLIKEVYVDGIPYAKAMP